MAANRRDHDERTPKQPHASIQGEGGPGCHQGRIDAGELAQQFDVHANRGVSLIKSLPTPLLTLPVVEVAGFLISTNCRCEKIHLAPVCTQFLCQTALPAE